MNKAGVSMSLLADRPEGNSEPNQPSLVPPPDRVHPSPRLSGNDAESKHKMAIHTQLLEILSKLRVLIDKTRPIQGGVGQEEQGSWSEEWVKEMHTTLNFCRLDIRFWLDDISTITSNLPDAFDGLADRNMELDQTLRETVQDMLQLLASLDEMVDLDTTDPSMSVA